jgi:iron(III) transport system ATP-binding protein
VLIRPEQILIAPGGEAAGVAAEVAEVTYFGHDTAVRLQLLDGTPILARVVGADAPPTGERVTLSVRGSVVAYPDRPEPQLTSR